MAKKAAAISTSAEPSAAASTALPAALSTGALAPAAPAKAYTVLARRYRSRDFSEVVGQDPISRTLQNAIATNRTAHAYLFCGTRGVGKTSMARIFARALNRDTTLTESDAIGDAILRGEDLDVIEIDGASNRGIDDARDLIAGAGLAPTRGRYRIYIIDEVHMLTTPAFNALLKTMEEPPSHVKFILCTTEPHKVPQTIQSRCQRFDFRNIPTKQIAAHLGAVAVGEGIVVTEEVLLAVGRLANGSMRDGLSLLDRLLAAASTGTIDSAVLEQVFGLPDDEILLSIVEACVCERPSDALLHGARLLERGSGVEQALELLAERFRWILVAAAAGSDSDLLEVAASMRDRVTRIAASSDLAYCAHAIALCDATARNARGSSAPRALYDACLVRLALAQRFAAGAALLASGASGASTSSTPRVASSALGGGTGLKKASDPAAVRAPGASESPARAIEPKIAPKIERTIEAKFEAKIEPKFEAKIEAKPALAAHTLAELLARIEAVAQLSAKDRALADSIELLECAADAVRVRLREEGGGARYLAGNPEPIRSLLARAAGRAMQVTIAPPVARATPIVNAALDATDPALRQDPIIRRALELFDATIVAVSPRGTADEGAATTDREATIESDA